MKFEGQFKVLELNKQQLIELENELVEVVKVFTAELEKGCVDEKFSCGQAYSHFTRLDLTARILKQFGPNNKNLFGSRHCNCSL